MEFSPAVAKATGGAMTLDEETHDDHGPMKLESLNQMEGSKPLSMDVAENFQQSSEQVFITAGALTYSDSN